MSAEQIRAGGAFVELGAKDAKLRDGLQAAAGNLRQFGRQVRTISRVSEGFAVMGGAARDADPAVGALVGSVTGLSAAFRLIATFSPIGILIGIAAAVATVAAALQGTEKDWKKATESAQKLREEGDKRRTTTLDQIDRLVDLADQERLNNSEMGEAQTLIKDLTRQYGNLGIALDTHTGKLTGATEAQKKLNELNKKDAIRNLTAELHAAEAEYKNIIGNVSGSDRGVLGIKGLHPIQALTDLVGASSAKDRATDSADRRADLLKEMAMLTERIALTEAANKEDKREGQTGSNAGGSAKAALDRKRKAEDDADERLKAIQDRLNDEAANELGRRLNAIRREHEEVDKLLAAKIEGEKTFGDHQAEIDALTEKRHENAVRQEMRRQEAIDDSRREAAQKRFEAEAKMQDDLDKLGIQASTTGYDQKIGLLALEMRDAFRAAAEQGLDPQLVAKQFALKFQIARQDHERELKESARGQFGGALAGQIFGSAQKTAITQRAASLKQLQKIDQTMQAVQRTIEQNGAVFA